MTDAARPLWPSILNGLACRCPRCGKGRLYRRYLRVVPQCPECGLELSGHRADDLPAYIVVTIVGHILVVGLFHFSVGAWNPAVLLALLVAAAIIVPVAILPSVKGAVVGLQYALRLHGFAVEEGEDAAEGVLDRRRGDHEDIGLQLPAERQDTRESYKLAEAFEETRDA